MAHCDDGLCHNCLYGFQPWGYFPIFCFYGKEEEELDEEKTDCKHFEPCPELPEPPKQEPWKVIITNKK